MSALEHRGDRGPENCDLADRTAVRTAHKMPISAPRIRGLSPRQSQFVNYVAAGCSLAEAYRRAYGKRGICPAAAASNGYRVARRPAVRNRLAGLRYEARDCQFFSIQARLKLLADIARDEEAKHSDRLHAIEIYTRIVGDAPARSGDRMPVYSSQGGAAVGVTRIPVAERLERLREAKRVSILRSQH